MVRFVSGRMGKKRKGSPPKRPAVWMPLSRIKNKTGLPIEEIHFILNQRGLWESGKPSEEALKKFLVRKHWKTKRYEWQEEFLTGIIYGYLRAGTKEARQDARKVRSAKANGLKRHSKPTSENNEPTHQ